MLSDRIQIIPKPAAPAPQPAPPPLSEAQKAYKAQLDTLKATKQTATSSQFGTLQVQTQLMQTKTRSLLSQEKSKLPQSCSSALFYSQSLMELIRMEIEVSDTLKPILNLTKTEQRWFQFNKLSANNRDHSQLMEKCSKEKGAEIPQPK